MIHLSLYSPSHQRLGPSRICNVYKHDMTSPRIGMAVAAGNSHTLIVGEDGSLFACGYNDYGQLGTGDTVSRFAPTRVVRLPRLCGR